MYDQAWVEAEMVGCYDDVTMIPELAKGVVTLLSTSKKSEELQNEVRPNKGQIVAIITWAWLQIFAVGLLRK